MTHVYRPGDMVEIVKPRWIKRVGYKLHWRDLLGDLQVIDSTHQMLKLIGWTGKVPDYFEQAVAKLYVERQGFGGNERSIHYYPLADGKNELQGSILELLLSDVYPSHGYVGRIVMVDRKRVAHTGIRVPPRCGVDHNNEYWEDTGGLENRKTHIILKTVLGEIEACDVKLVKAAS